MRALFLILIAAAACSQAQPEPQPAPLPSEHTETTYERDVAPIIAHHCASCHEEGGIAPFPLQSYEDAAPRADQIAVAVLEQTMPPYGVDNSGACNEYTDARWLSPAERATISTWAMQGAPRGIGPPNAIKPSEPPRAIIPAATIDIGVDYIPDRSLADDYRCFVVDAAQDRDRFLTGYAVHPGEKSIVHHIILYGLADEEAEAEVRTLEDADDRPGYACFGGPGTNNIRFLAGWAPGVTETRYPERTGIRVPAARKMVMQIHYHSGPIVLSDRTRIDLELTDQVELEAIVLPLADLELALPPGEEQAIAEAEATIEAPHAYDIYGVFPHMHRLGRSLRVENNSSCLVDVPSWSFDWQQFYFYKQPLHAGPGDRVKLTCTFDTRSKNEVIEWGEGTDDEMCLAGFYVVKKD